MLAKVITLKNSCHRVSRNLTELFVPKTSPPLALKSGKNHCSWQSLLPSQPEPREILHGFWICPRSKCRSTWEQSFSLGPKLIIMLSRRQVAIHLPSCHILTFCYKELNLQISAQLCCTREKQNDDYQPVVKQSNSDSNHLPRAI